MATYKSFPVNGGSSPIPSLQCDICGSHTVIETREGYVCKECGIELEIPKLHYNIPYKEQKIQHAKGLGGTKIGTMHERGSCARSYKLDRLHKHNSILTPKKIVIGTARSEINRLFGALNLSEYSDIKEMVFKKFKKIHAQIRPSSKYRNVENLVSITMYLCLKLKNISINPYELISLAKITKKEFRNFMLQLRRFLPEYDTRNRQFYILQRISQIVEYFNLGMPLYFFCKKMLYKLWQGIKSTTDDVIAGLISSIAVLCTCKEKVNINTICTHLGIRMSTIQSQVKKNVFERFGVDGFTTLIKSSDILKEIIAKLGLLDPIRV